MNSNPLRTDSSCLDGGWMRVHPSDRARRVDGTTRKWNGTTNASPTTATLSFLPRKTNLQIDTRVRSVTFLLWFAPLFCPCLVLNFAHVWSILAFYPFFGFPQAINPSLSIWFFWTFFPFLFFLLINCRFPIFVLFLSICRHFARPGSSPNPHPHRSLRQSQPFIQNDPTNNNATK